MMNNASRKIFIKTNEIRKVFNLSSIILFIVSVGGYGIAFLTLMPNSSFIFWRNIIVSPYFVMNVSLFFIILSSLSWIIVNSIWFFTRNSPSLLSIKPDSPNGTRTFAYVKISNDEPQGLKSVRLNIINLIDKDGFDRVPHMGEFANISKEVNLSKETSCKIDFAEGKSGALWIMADKRYEPLMARKPNEEYFVTFDVYAEPNKEGREFFCGRYKGKIKHDKYQNQDAISWLDKEFVEIKITKRKSK